MHIVAVLVRGAAGGLGGHDGVVHIAARRPGALALGHFRQVGGAAVVGVDGRVHVIIADVHLHPVGHVALQGGDAVASAAQVDHIVNKAHMDGLVVGAAVHQDVAGLGDHGGAVHALVGAQELAHAGLLHVHHALHGVEALGRVVRGIQEVLDLMHRHTGLHHAPGHIAGAPAEADALAAPFGELVAAREGLAGQGLPLGVGDVQRVLDDLRRLGGLGGDHHRRRGGGGGGGLGRGDQHQHGQGQQGQLQHVLHHKGFSLSCSGGVVIPFYHTTLRGKREEGSGGFYSRPPGNSSS